MDVSGLLVAEGATAQASGRVLVTNGETWFEGPGPVMLVYPPPTPAPGRFAVRAHGVDLAGLDRRSEDNGVLTGWATLIGVWSDHELHVRHQGPTGRAAQPDRPPAHPAAPAAARPAAGLDQARSRLHEEMRSGGWPLTSFGDTSAADGQPQLNVRLAWIVAEMVEWATTLPDGMLDLDVWLTPPVRSSPTPGSPA